MTVSFIAVATNFAASLSTFLTKLSQNLISNDSDNGAKQEEKGWKDVLGHSLSILLIDEGINSLLHRSTRKDTEILIIQKLVYERANLDLLPLRSFDSFESFERDIVHLHFRSTCISRFVSIDGGEEDGGRTSCSSLGVKLNDVSWIRYEIYVILTESLRISNIVFRSLRLVPVDLHTHDGISFVCVRGRGKGTHSKSDEGK